MPSRARTHRVVAEVELAAAAKVSRATLAEFEAGNRMPYDRTIDDIKGALESAGCIFIEGNGEGPGVRLRKTAKGVEEISRQIDALEGKISSMTAPTEPSPESAMNTMRKAVAESDLTKLKTRRKQIKGKPK